MPNYTFLARFNLVIPITLTFSRHTEGLSIDKTSVQPSDTELPSPKLKLNTHLTEPPKRKQVSKGLWAAAVKHHSPNENWSCGDEASPL